MQSNIEINSKKQRSAARQVKTKVRVLMRNRNGSITDLDTLELLRDEHGNYMCLKDDQYRHIKGTGERVRMPNQKCDKCHRLSTTRCKTCEMLGWNRFYCGVLKCARFCTFCSTPLIPGRDELGLLSFYLNCDVCLCDRYVTTHDKMLYIKCTNDKCNYFICSPCSHDILRKRTDRVLKCPSCRQNAIALKADFDSVIARLERIRVNRDIPVDINAMEDGIYRKIDVAQLDNALGNTVRRDETELNLRKSDWIEIDRIFGLGAEMIRVIRTNRGKRINKFQYPNNLNNGKTNKIRTSYRPSPDFELTDEDWDTIIKIYNAGNSISDSIQKSLQEKEKVNQEKEKKTNTKKKETVRSRTKRRRRETFREIRIMDNADGVRFTSYFSIGSRGTIMRYLKPDGPTKNGR